MTDSSVSNKMTEFKLNFDSDNGEISKGLFRGSSENDKSSLTAVPLDVRIFTEILTHILHISRYVSI